jgi:hypothetical protein
MSYCPGLTKQHKKITKHIVKNIGTNQCAPEDIRIFNAYHQESLRAFYGERRKRWGYHPSTTRR